MNDQRWQDWPITIAGLFVYFATWLVPATTTAGLTISIVGFLISIFGISGLASPHRWKEWFQLALGLCLMGCPFFLGFNEASALTYTAVSGAAIVIVSSSWALISDNFDLCARGLR